MGGRRKGKGAYNKPDIKGINTGKKLYPVSDVDIEKLKDASQRTTTVKPDGMGKDSFEAIKEFLKKKKE